MTISLGGNDISQIVEIAGLVGTIVAMLLGGLIVYLMVRPPRRLREERRRRAAEPAEAEALIALIERMEIRLEVLERALADETERRRFGAREDTALSAPAPEGRKSGRME